MSSVTARACRTGAMSTIRSGPISRRVSRFSYSGEGYLYLQRAVEAVTGEKLPALAQRLVFEPLAMTRSSFVWQPHFDDNKAWPHDAFGAPALGNKPGEATLRGRCRPPLPISPAFYRGPGWCPVEAWNGQALAKAAHRHSAQRHSVARASHRRCRHRSRLGTRMGLEFGPAPSSTGRQWAFHLVHDRLGAPSLRGSSPSPTARRAIRSCRRWLRKSCPAIGRR